MAVSEAAGAVRSWTVMRDAKARRLAAVGSHANGKLLDQHAMVEALEALIQPGDRVALEGNNQKQADFLSRALVQVDPRKVHDIHLLISTVSRPEHLTLFERGIARREQVQAAHHRQERRRTHDVSRVFGDVDDARVAASGQNHRSFRRVEHQRRILWDIVLDPAGGRIER